jgi:hypothetical protein
LLKGSSLHQAVQAGPHGSRFVSPATLTAASGKAPVSLPWPKNYWAS